MKKVLIIALTDGFIRSFLENDIILLKNRGYEIHCAGQTTDREENFELRKKYDIVFHEVEFSGRKPFSRTNLKALKTIAEIIRTDDFDLIHCHTPVVATVTKLACAICRFRSYGILIYTSHGFYFHKYAPKKAWLLYYPIEWITAKLCDCIVTINSEDYKNARKMPCKNVFKINGVGMNRAIYLNESVDRIDYRKNLGVDEDALVILGMGQLSARKNYELAIRGIAQSGVKNAVLILCGNAAPGSGRLEYLTNLADELNVRVKFLGYRTDITKITKCADIGTIPSRREGLGMSGLEMLRAGLPLIASNVHGIMDYMRDGVNGYLVNPDDTEGYAKAIIMLSDSRIRENMREKCIRSTEMFDNSISMKQLDNVYTHMLQ